MGVTIAVMRQAIPTGTGTQNFTTTDCGGLTPKAAYFIMSKGLTDGSVASNSGFCVGSTDGTRQWAWFCQSQDAAATTATDRGSEQDHLLAMQDVAGALEGSAVFSAWITNGITLNFDDAFPAAYLLTIIFFCGTDVTAYVGTSDLVNTLDLEVDITAPGFQPELILPVTSFRNGDGVSVASEFSTGVVKEVGGAVTQRSQGMRSNDASATVGMGARYTELYGLVRVSGSGAIIWAVEFANFDSSGFSMFTRVAGAGGNDMGYLALDFNGVVDIFVGTVASPTSTGDAAITAPGFTPQFVMQGLSMAEAAETSYGTDNANSLGAGVATPTAQFSTSFWDDDAALDSNAECISDNVPINIQNGVDGTGLVASFVSFDANGWTYNYSDVEAAAKQSWALAIEAPASAFLPKKPIIINQSVNRAGTF